MGKKQGIQIHLETFVTKVESNVVHAKCNGEEFRLNYGTLVWCAGVKPHNFIKNYGFQMDQKGQRILTDRTLRVVGEADIYAIGDCASVRGNPLPQTAQVANQEGMYLAKHLNDGRPPNAPFKFESKGVMASLGGMRAVMAD